MNIILSFFSFSYTALTELGFRQEVEHIRANVFYQRFKRFFPATFLMFFNVFNFLEMFFLHLQR